MKMSDPIPQYTHFITALRDSHPNLAYLHVIEPGLPRGSAVASTTNESNDFIRDIWAPRPLIVAGGFTRESALERSKQTDDLIAFGKPFISNVCLSALYQVYYITHKSFSGSLTSILAYSRI